MNNNMPNNFENGMSNAAKENLMGGQNLVNNNNNNSNVMQGVSNLQNNQGIMQGTPNLQNNPGIMQGVAMPKNNSANQTIPGQNHSGINAVTLQKEEIKQENPGVVSIPNFTPNEPSAPKTETNMPKMDQTISSISQGVPQTPQPVSPNVNNPGTVNNALKSEINSVANEIKQNPVGETFKSAIGGINQNASVTENASKPSPIMQQPLGINEMSNMNQPQQLNPMGNANINQPINNQNSIGQSIIPNQKLNTTGGIQNTSVTENAPKPSPIMQQPLGINEMSNMNQPQQQNAIGNTNTNQPINNQNSIGQSIAPNQNITSNQSINDLKTENDIVEMPDLPDKRFPLSLREMILIGIAIIGIIAVVIMYWPK